ncbi:hypothetical protein HK100_000065 [Physocladia obscura]|uniref:Uncharacterized protein n=1 Tax=Physocladia obscura TaxID=109957 RepID=A0AAD5XCT2_9FUNG|nr:hypothetical protein HK100_000065 [Physocladia obscura]
MDTANTAVVVMIAIAGAVLVLTVVSCCGCVTVGASPVASRMRRKRGEQKEQKELHRRRAAVQQQQQQQQALTSVTIIAPSPVSNAPSTSCSPSGTLGSQRALLSPVSSASLNSAASSSKSHAPSVFFSAKLRQQLASLGAAVPDQAADYSAHKIAVPPLQSQIIQTMQPSAAAATATTASVFNK